MNYSIVVPTLNGGQVWNRAAQALASQRPRPSRLLVIDSGSTDQTVVTAREHDFEVRSIEASNFDHGGTRQLAVEQLAEAEVIVFLTQDAVLLREDSVANLIDAFQQPEIGAAYGRQIPSTDASEFEQHARTFNYPESTVIKSAQSIADLGLKTAFCSNSFAAYRRSTLQEVGGFPARTLFAEDMLVAARMIVAGYSVAYQADALCEHWHDYTVVQEFKRAFDIGAFHHRESWILDVFGKAPGEGAKLIKTGLSRILAKNPKELPTALFKYLAKTVGYMTGRLESSIPVTFKKKLSMNRVFWTAHD